MSDNRMPRGMLRGCQARAYNLEPNRLLVVAVSGLIRALVAGFLAFVIAIAEPYRTKTWWEDLPLDETIPIEVDKE